MRRIACLMFLLAGVGGGHEILSFFHRELLGGNRTRFLWPLTDEETDRTIELRHRSDPVERNVDPETFSGPPTPTPRATPTPRPSIIPNFPSASPSQLPSFYPSVLPSSSEAPQLSLGPSNNPSLLPSETTAPSSSVSPTADRASRIRARR